MTIYRRIVQLKPDVKLEELRLPRGINMLVLDYDERIVELWGSDTTELKAEERCDGAKLEGFISALAPLKTLRSHPGSPRIIGQIWKGDVLVDEG